ncbi:MAG: polysaccharide biosynthesis protein [Candidatus Sumerlaeia bacterium]
MSYSRIKWMLMDACLTVASFAIAYGLLLYAFSYVPKAEVPHDVYITYLTQALLGIGIFIIIRLSFFSMFDLYRSISRFMGMHELRQVILAVTAGSLVFGLWNAGLLTARRFQDTDTLPYLFDRIPFFLPIPVLLVEWMSSLVLVGGARLAWRLWQLIRISRGTAIHNVLIIGAGDEAASLARSFLRNPQIGYMPIGFIDEDKDVWGKHIHGLTVFGGLEDLPSVLEKKDVAEVLVAIPHPSLRFLNQVVETCERVHVSLKMIPAVSDVMKERVSISQIRNVEIEDLLGREAIAMVLPEEMNYFRDETVLITGAGGSIGSELSRQISECGPKKILLLGRGENSIYEIANELSLKEDAPELVQIIANVQDVDRMQYIFEEYKPTVIVHAAAHKHVPLMEMHPVEAVKNNIFGTYNVAFLAKQYKTKRFLFISTDKAVRPTSVMGASKRVAEMIVSALSIDSETTYVSVRFGNVLGSRGSVVPLFRKQIAAGGPVKVTHPEVERYFMTIPEAVNLVLHAGAIGADGQNGQLFLLDMGEPVKIVDLARRMITLSGYEPDVDIEIQFIGLRPGEKLKEELLTQTENMNPTMHHKIFGTRVQCPELEQVKSWLRLFDELILENQHDQIVGQLRDIVPEFVVEAEPLTPEIEPSSEAE